MEEKLRELKEGNRIATALTIIAWVIFVGGFIAGIALGNVEVTMHNEADIWTEEKFSFAVAFGYWVKWNNDSWFCRNNQIARGNQKKIKLFYIIVPILL